MLLEVNGDAVSADIAGAPLAEVAGALETELGVKMHFPAPWMKRRAIDVRFEALAPEVALQTLLEGISYVLVAGSAEDGNGMQIYLCSSSPPGAEDRHLARREANGHRGQRESEPQAVSPVQRDPLDLPAQPADADPDPAVRVLELQAAVASHDQESLPLVISGMQDTDAAVRSAAERLVLDHLRGVVPKDILSRMALTSEQAAVRQQALEVMALERNDLEHARITLDSASRDVDPDVRQLAAELLAQLPEPKP